VEEDIDVDEVLEAGKMVGEDHLIVIIVMSRDILLDIFLFQDVLGVPNIETTPTNEDFPELIVKWEYRARQRGEN
jgi:hypothetical protein